MDALSFLKVKFPFWEAQDRQPFNTVSLRESNLVEAMEEYAELKVQLADKESLLKQENSTRIEEFPQVMFSPVGKKSADNKSLYSFGIEYNLPGLKVCDFDKIGKMIEVEEKNGERYWLNLPDIFKTIDFDKPTRIKQLSGEVLSVALHSVYSYPSKDGEKVVLNFEKID